VKIDKVTVSVGETFPKKHTKYATWRTDLSYAVTLEEGENPNEVRESLYKKATHDLRIMKENIYKDEDNA